MSLSDLFGGDPFVPGQTVRTEPIQQRSTARLSGLLDAAAVVVDEVGFDRITTAMVAERAGASIGTVYRYYPDRVAVLQALRERAVQRYRQRVADELKQSSPQTWWDAVDCSITAFVDLYRSEPGFRIMHFSDRELSPITADLDSGFFARQLAVVLAEEFGLAGGAELTFRLEVAVEMADSILSRAFRANPQGDERFIAECRRVMQDYLLGYYGPGTA
ncbi:TetR/AcrR family transcriptional regulator [Cryobacterium sp. TMT1-21]|uniref:TetR/AcrR family transcriptional regulator n=1 Tax=Cryobacterium shii TaxID=1259235 RepID=A0AAQ2HF67_9MICO|nr:MULTISPECIES: TetR/AcrR family transcriptional regulator [Cryobacterium]TFC45862.1 TetR/AcrR family transcriptional regulator [Cryobacterium shii]TFC84421.1 TetR/AcrR family transcriptional regulator [Cryobacterium sp. TmT2-59]TFD08724.1 TetR/AcrR family transcriptional regulator [Cryobacterium sp. TMT1-21]TFD18513.1 TetR/AcrR family transcriptional regulator [Cryobacterium sp. TMT4-10]TFD26297.1 TetR/AcrR family transcriptional regulator [Cryobacterium sp. TMT2-23]